MSEDGPPLASAGRRARYLESDERSQCGGGDEGAAPVDDAQAYRIIIDAANNVEILQYVSLGLRLSAGEPWRGVQLRGEDTVFAGGWRAAWDLADTPLR
jgi:hypothetical protein